MRFQNFLMYSGAGLVKSIGKR